MEKKIKLLAISDNIALNTGVGIQCRKILVGLQKSGKFECVELGGSLLRNTQPFMFEGVKVYPTGGESYGNALQVRQLMQIEKPDIVLAFSDPRFFTYLFNMDDEIRQFAKLVFYHTWDNEPFPKFNLPYYSACDEIIMISKFSHELMLKGGVECSHIPHMQNLDEFYPLSEKDIKKELDILKQLVGNPKLDFLIFWNNRNLDRKRPGDVITAFQKFHKTHPNSALLMNTSPIDPEGTDLLALQRDILDENLPIIFNFNQVTASKLNEWYNAADVTVNISYAEGFGLCISESLCAGTPVICTKTGGMTEQATTEIYHPAVDNGVVGCPEHTEHKQFGVVLEPAVRNLYGVPGAPYIYKDMVSEKDLVIALEIMYQDKKSGHLKKLGEEGRRHMLNRYNEENLQEVWVDKMTKVFNSPSKFQKIKLEVVR